MGAEGLPPGTVEKVEGQEATVVFTDSLGQLHRRRFHVALLQPSNYRLVYRDPRPPSVPPTPF